MISALGTLKWAMPNIYPQFKSAIILLNIILCKGQLLAMLLCFVLVDDLGGSLGLLLPLHTVIYDDNMIIATSF